VLDVRDLLPVHLICGGADQLTVICHHATKFADGWFWKWYTAATATRRSTYPQSAHISTAQSASSVLLKQLLKQDSSLHGARSVASMALAVVTML
jgi:hypothetical protein